MPSPSGWRAGRSSRTYGSASSRIRSRLNRGARLEHLKTEHLISPFRTERVFARFQAFVHFDSIQVGGQARDVDADGLGRVLGLEQDLAVAALGIELVELKAFGGQFGGLKKEDGRGQ